MSVSLKISGSSGESAALREKKNVGAPAQGGVLRLARGDLHSSPLAVNACVEQTRSHTYIHPRCVWVGVKSEGQKNAKTREMDV